MVASSEFAGLAGASSPCPTAVLAMVPETFGLATTSSVAESPLGTLPKVHSTSLPSWWPVPQGSGS